MKTEKMKLLFNRLFFGTVLTLVTAAPRVALATPVTFELANAFYENTANQSGVIFTSPGDWLYVDFSSGSMFLTIDEQGPVANIRVTGSANGHFVGNTPTGNNNGTFTRSQGTYSFDIAFQAAVLPTGGPWTHKAVGLQADIGTITNPNGEISSFMLPAGEIRPAIYLSIAGDLGVRNLVAAGCFGGEAATADFHFVGHETSRTEVPEPTTVALLSCGLLGHCFRRKRG